jgi:hypothetical protein
MLLPVVMQQLSACMPDTTGEQVSKANNNDAYNNTTKNTGEPPVT